MEIAIIADDRKKELVVEFCIAYCGILTKHHLCATSKTAKYITEATGIPVEPLLSGDLGGAQQLTSRISYNEVDMLIFFRSTTPEGCRNMEDNNLLRMCDLYNVPVATNVATAEILVRALERGDLDWRELVNPRSPYNTPKE